MYVVFLIYLHQNVVRIKNRAREIVLGNIYVLFGMLYRKYVYYIIYIGIRHRAEHNKVGENETFVRNSFI